MENKSHAIAAGIFVVLLAGLLIALASWLTRDTSRQRPYEVSSKDAVTGLQPQAGVRYKGVTVGRVTAIALDAQTRGHVLVRIAVNDDVPITTTTFASLGFQGVTGLAFVQLDDDSADAAQPLPTSSTHPGRIPMRAGLVARLTEQGTQLLAQMEQISQRTNQLLAPENQQTLVTAIGNLSQAAAGINQLTRHADQVLTGSGPEGSASLPQMVAQTQATFKSMQTTSERLKESAEVVKNSAEQFRRTNTRMNEPGGTLDKIARTTEETARTVRQFGRVAEGLSDQPQSLLLGKSAAAPGPGEPGFAAPTSNKQE